MIRGALSLGQRTAVFFVYALFAYIGYSAAVVHRAWTPSGGGADLWFLSVAGLAAVRLIETPFFRKPSDSFLAGFTTIFALWAVEIAGRNPVRGLAETIRWTGVIYAGIIMTISLMSIWLLHSRDRREKSSQILYRLSTRMGAPEIMFTFPVFVAAFAFHDRGATTAALIAAWLLMCVARPVEEILRIGITALERTAATEVVRVGTVRRIDSPNLIRVSLENVAAWQVDKVHAVAMPDGSRSYVLPLFTQLSSTGPLGTGLVAGEGPSDYDIQRGAVMEYTDAPQREDLVAELLGGATATPLIGFVVETSNIARIVFEISSHEELEEGTVVFCQPQAKKSVYYQIVAAQTVEESFDKNPRGTVRVTAAQLGSLDAEKKFSWYPWVPPMNTPVFKVGDLTLPDIEDALNLGAIPGTRINAELRFDKALEFHTAVLGSTGMGKTELVFDIIREGLSRNSKVFCVDFTGEYKVRLADLDPQLIGLAAGDIEKLNDLVESVETGDYGGAKEKQALIKFLKEVRPTIAKQITAFLESEEQSLAVFELEDIANTRATLRTTEIYLSQIFGWARKHRKARRILLVLEEAHTIIPEFNLFSYDKNETQAVVGRMSQIALQGRKYGVGILLVSQRTALVSKTVLSQCNTHLCFSVVDKTSLDYLSSILGADHLSALPNLRQRQFIAHGTAVIGDRPIIVERPYDPAKEAASRTLDVTLSTAPPQEDATESPFEEDDDGLPF